MVEETQLRNRKGGTTNKFHLKLSTFENVRKMGGVSHLADSEYIKTGYRTRLSCRDALRSTCAWHNETCNIYTHLLGVIIFFFFLAECVLIGLSLDNNNISSISGLIKAPKLSSSNYLGLHQGNETVVAPFGDLVLPTLEASQSALSNSTLYSQVDWHAGVDVEIRKNEDQDWYSRLRRLTKKLKKSTTERLLESMKRHPKFMEGLTHVINSVHEAVSNLQKVQQIQGREVYHLLSEPVISLEKWMGKFMVHLDEVEPMHSEHDGEPNDLVQAFHAGLGRFYDSIHSIKDQMPGVNVGKAPTEQERGMGVAKAVPVWPVFVFIFGAISCMSASVLFHLFSPVSLPLFELLARLDYTFISVLICASTVPPIFYGFWCAETTRNIYIGLTVAACIICMTMGISKRFQTPEWRIMRTLAFVASGLLGGVPLVHMVLQGDYSLSEMPSDLEIDGVHTTNYVSSTMIWGIIFMGLQYLIGAALYAARLPERLAPGRFDLIGASHNIFHILVVTAATTHYVTVMDHFFWRVQNSMCPV